MDTWERFSLALEEAKQAKKLDPVGHEDADVDNDGDVDSSDKYLKNRRSAVGAAIAADRKKKVEEAKQLDPVGQEDKDIDNDGDHDKTDKYLLNRRKVRSKIIQAKEEVELVDEGKADKKLPEHKRSAARLARYDNPSGALALGGGQQRARRAEHEERRGVKKEELEIEEGMSMKDFKSNRKKLQRKEASADAEKRGHVGKEWHNTGRKYSPDEAKSRRAKMSDDDRRARYGSAEDPDSEDYSNYPASKTKNPKKLRKQKAMGEGYIQEKALSRAQQRFMGMVYAAKKGETPASPEVAKAAEGMTKKSARDFAKTKHAGLPEKKEETKEELSLVDRMIIEFSPLNEGKLDDLLADIRSEDDNEKKASSERTEKKTEQQRKQEAAKKVKRGKSDPSALTRRAAVAGATRLQAEKEKTKRQRERQEYEKKRREEKATQKALKEREQERRTAEEEKKRAKKQRRSELKQDIKNAWSGNLQVASDKKDTEAVKAQMSNIGSVIGGVAKTAGALGKYALKKGWEKRQERKKEEQKKKEEGTQQEQFSNWREEFIFEIEDMSTQKDQKKVIDVSKKKNKIEINPNMSESCGCEKEEETPKKDMRSLPTKVNLLKTKARAMGVKNPIVMVASEENVQELAALAPLVGRLVGGVAAKGVASRIAGGAAQGSLRAKAGELIGQKVGDIASQTIQDRMTPKEESPKEDEYYMTNLERKLRKEDWQAVNRKDKTDGLSQKAVDAYRRENPGSKLQTAVTEKKPEGKRAERRKSFCRRMSGMKDKLTSAETARDPDSRINKALRRWNCN